MIMWLNRCFKIVHSDLHEYCSIVGSSTKFYISRIQGLHFIYDLVTSRYLYNGVLEGLVPTSNILTNITSIKRINFQSRSTIVMILVLKVFPSTVAEIRKLSIQKIVLLQK